MTYKTRQPLFGFWLSISLCLATANCGDPAAGSWTNTMPPSGSASQYMTYMTTLTFGDANSVTVDLETTRSMGALTYAGCSESLLGTGTYTEVGGVITSSFAAGTNSRMSCVYPIDNLTAMPIDSAAKATLLSLSGGTFTVAANVLTLTTAGASIKYNRGQ